MKKNNTQYNINANLNPWAVTGFTDAEGCFYLIIRPKSSTKTQWGINLYFSIILNNKDKKLLEEIQHFFGVGSITEKTTRPEVQYSVTSIKDLEKIVNHFDNFPLISAKSSDYILWREAFEIIKSKEHLKLEGLHNLVGLKASLNLGLSDSLKGAFPQIIPVIRPNYIFQGIPDGNWLAGFTSGDGSLSVSTKNNKAYKTGKQIQLTYSINLHQRETDLIKGIRAFLLEDQETKYIYKDESRNKIQLVFNNLTIINEKIIPFFDKFPLIGAKANDYLFFKEIFYLMQNNEHLTELGLAKILAIREKMNNYNS
jgi:hypothetical protein